jgi:hypothetical protein
VGGFLYGHSLHTQVLASNHYHPLLQTPKGNLNPLKNVYGGSIPEGKNFYGKFWPG